jgi:hypothetical protein
LNARNCASIDGRTRGSVSVSSRSRSRSTRRRFGAIRTGEPFPLMVLMKATGHPMRPSEQSSEHFSVGEPMPTGVAIGESPVFYGRFSLCAYRLRPVRVAFHAGDRRFESGWGYYWRDPCKGAVLA